MSTTMPPYRVTDNRGIEQRALSGECGQPRTTRVERELRFAFGVVSNFSQRVSSADGVVGCEL